MVEKQGNPDFNLRVFVRYRTEGSEYQQTQLIDISRKAGARECQIILPERDDIVSTGWVPEIVYKNENETDSFEIVIRPDLKTFSKLKNGRSQHPCEQSEERAVGPETRITSSPPEDAVTDPILYEVTFKNQEVRLNGLRLSRPNFNSENELVFDYLYKNPNRRIELPEIEAGIKRPIIKRLREIVRDLGFRKDLKEMFFPGISKTAIKFINPITREDFIRRELGVPDIGIR